MKLTKKEALEQCVTSWKKILELGTAAVKEQVLKPMDTRFPILISLLKLKASDSIYINDCPCCEYSYDENVGLLICKNCPLFNLWPGTGFLAPCEYYGDSPYRLLRKALSDYDLDGFTANCQRIINFAQKELDDGNF